MHTPLVSRRPTVDASVPLFDRLRSAPLYPLRGAALAALLTLTAARLLVGLLPGAFAWSLGFLIWVSVFMYALECLRHTADGYARPPEVSLHPNNGPGIALLLVQALAIVLTSLAYYLFPPLWLVLGILIVVLPAMTMSLAFGDSAMAAFNPALLVRAIGGLGPAYLLPLGLEALRMLVYLTAVRQHGFVDRTLWALLTTYLVLLDFHVMGAIMHRYHERIGHLPESATLAAAGGLGVDEQLLEDVRALADEGDAGAAETLLRERIAERNAPAAVHMAYRRLLRARDARDALLAHAQTCIATLLAGGEVRRALAVARESVELDAHFMPDDPAIAAELADAAAAQGMTHLALKLARGYPNTWPRDARAPHYGLVAARLLAERMGQRAEAGVLASKLARAYAGHPEHAEIEAFLAGLGMQAGPAA